MSEHFHITLTPALLARLEQAGLVPGAGNVAVWLTERAERAQDFEDDARKVKSGQCAPDEVHCSCVPHLRRQIAEVEKERDDDERDTAGIFEDIGHYHFFIPSPDARAEEAEAVAAVNAWAHDEDGTIEAPALAVQVRALIAAARERDEARAEVARLRASLVEPTEETSDPDSEQGEGVAR